MQDANDIVEVMSIDLRHTNTADNASSLELVSGPRSSPHAQVSAVDNELFPLGVPLDEPACRFDNSACDMTLEITFGVVLVAAILLVLLGYWLHRRRQYAHLMSMSWRIDLDEMHVVVDGERSPALCPGKSCVVLHSPLALNYSRVSRTSW